MTGLFQPYFTVTFGGPTGLTKEERQALSNRVNDDLRSLGISVLDVGPKELPAPPPELLDTYAVAYTEAVRKCAHTRSSTCMSYSRGEHQCDDCGRYFVRKVTLFG